MKRSLVDMNEILWHAEDQAYILVGPINKHAWTHVALQILVGGAI